MKVQRIANVSISTVSAEPLRGMVEITTANSAMLFELDEELAHRLCSELERFLTQVPQRSRKLRMVRHA
jgi:hypothetical protein